MKSKSLKAIKFRLDHIHQIDVRSHEGFGAYSLENFEDKMVALAYNSVETSTYVIGGEILCIAGYVELWPGVIEVWVIPSKIVPKNVRAFAQNFAAWITTLNKEYHRIQTSCLDDPLHNRWLTWLGFEKEGVMRKYTKDLEDYAMFAKVR